MTTTRDRAKAQRREALLSAASRLFAERGFERVSLEELGAATGISGPAIYRHFASKQAVLAAILLETSRHLLEGGNAVVRQAPDAEGALRDLIGFHLDFALERPEVIRVQDRDLDSLPPAQQHEVRQLQRTYVELWVGVLTRLHPHRDTEQVRTRAQAVFGLMNSTPHSGRQRSSESTRAILEPMALTALLS